MRGLALLSLAVISLVGCKPKTMFTGSDDAGTICEGNDHLINGECRFVCSRDGDCATGERCNLFTGQCEAKAEVPDAGPLANPCTTGANRCTTDNKAIESCGDAGTWATSETCPVPSGFCLNERCLVCQPGVSTCVAGMPTQKLVCDDLGSATHTVTCSGTATCQAGECRECAPDAVRCSPDGKSVQTCTRAADETDTWKWVGTGDNFDGTCITQVCETDGTAGSRCRAPDCFPLQARCQDSRNRQECTAVGQWGPPNACAGVSSECVGGTCLDECADAVAAKSYFGCDFWTAVQDNGVNPLFRGGVSTATQGTLSQISDFAFVVANRSASDATVTVQRVYGGAIQTVATQTVKGRLDTITKGVAQIKVPWQAIGAGTGNLSASGLQRWAYRITSTKPLTVYQFNPLDAVKKTGSCTTVSQCTQVPANEGPACVAGVCNYFSYSNDASLLLPAHILGNAYVAMAPEHIVYRSGSTSATPATDPWGNGHITIVATEDNTQVSVRSNARTYAGANVPSIAKGGTQAFTLQAYDVLQIASMNPASVPAGSDFECRNTDFNSPCGGFLEPSCDQYVCRVDNNLTGSIVSSDKPVAVFGGSACYVRGHWNAACDHVEEQLFPFSTWGKNFVAGRSAPYRLQNNNFAAANAAGPDYYQVVAGCPASNPLCPSGGTLITFSQAPAAGDVLAPNRCTSGSIAGNNCRLAAGAYMEFRSKASFTISSDAPIAVGQFFSSQSATTGSGTSAPATGDPSFILLPPVEQWRTNYTVLTAPGVRDNYLGIVIDAAKVLSVQVDGVAVNGFTAVSGTSTVPGATFQVLNVPVNVGTHTLEVTPRPNQNPLPGAGITVYGFDSYVSYGYTGGLDLSTIVTGINPGG